MSCQRNKCLWLKLCQLPWDLRVLLLLWEAELPTNKERGRFYFEVIFFPKLTNIDPKNLPNILEKEKHHLTATSRGQQRQQILWRIFYGLKIYCFFAWISKCKLMNSYNHWQKVPQTYHWNFKIKFSKIWF